jgi:acid stress-induced BolA-like protein IbaG/YrbA
MSPISNPGPSNVSLAIQDAILSSMPGAIVVVTPKSPGHFDISVVSEEFRGKTRVASQRLVYKAITALMAGDRAPVHAVDQLETRLP